jgi:hypothetical protein
MLLPRSTTAVLLVFVTPLFLHMPFKPSVQENVERSPERISPRDIPPANCHVTLPSDGVYEPPFQGFGPSQPSQFYFGTENLWTVLPRDGTWRGPYPGAARDDLVYENKIPWSRHTAALKVGPLTVKGKRLDGPAPTFVGTDEPFGYNRGGIIGGISIPVYGCWEITAQYDDQRLTFTVWVTSLATHEPSSPASSPETLAEQPAHRVQSCHESTSTPKQQRVHSPTKYFPRFRRRLRQTNTYGTRDNRGGRQGTRSELRLWSASPRAGSDGCCSMVPIQAAH